MAPSSTVNYQITKEQYQWLFASMSWKNMNFGGKKMHKKGQRASKKQFKEEQNAT